MWQPHATAIAAGLKRYETRSWRVGYKGPVVICAGKRLYKHEFEAWDMLAAQFLEAAGVQLKELPYGCAVAVARLVECHPAEEIRGEFWGDFAPGRFAWELRDVRKIVDPFPVVGRQNLFFVDVAVPFEVTSVGATPSASLQAQRGSIQ